MSVYFVGDLVFLSPASLRWRNCRSSWPSTAERQTRPQGQWRSCMHAFRRETLWKPPRSEVKLICFWVLLPHSARKCYSACNVTEEWDAKCREIHHESSTYMHKQRESSWRWRREVNIKKKRGENEMLKENTRWRENQRETVYYSLWVQL